MKSSDLVVGTVYAINSSPRSWTSSNPGVLVSTTPHAEMRNSATGTTSWHPHPQRVAKSRFGARQWGLPVAVLLDSTSLYNERKRGKLDAKIKRTGIDWSTVKLDSGEQTIKGVRFRLQLHPPSHFMSTWADAVERQVAREQAQIDQEAAKEALEAHLTSIEPDVRRLLAGVTHHFSTYDSKITIYDVDAFLEHLQRKV